MSEFEPLDIASRHCYLLEPQASSSKNFAVKLLRNMFKASELSGRNICWERGKDSVDPVRVAKINIRGYKFYPRSPFHHMNRKIFSRIAIRQWTHFWGSYHEKSRTSVTSLNKFFFEEEIAKFNNGKLTFWVGAEMNLIFLYIFFFCMQWYYFITRLS